MVKELSFGNQWLTPIILATWEVESGWIAVRGQSGQKSSGDPISNSIWAQQCVSVIPAISGKHKVGGSQSRPAWAKCKPLSPK
jgi:hypothetical protein